MYFKPATSRANLQEKGEYSQVREIDCLVGESVLWCEVVQQEDLGRVRLGWGQEWRGQISLPDWLPWKRDLEP